MKKQNFLIYLFFAVAIFLVSCKGEDGEVGPAGPAGQDANPTQDWAYKEGFVKGTAEGTLLDATNYSYDFDFQGNWAGSDNRYSVKSPTETAIIVEKTYSGEGETFVYWRIEFKI